MDIKKIKSIVNIFKDAGLSTLDLKDGDFELRLEKKVETDTPISPPTSRSNTNECTVEACPSDHIVNFNDLTEVKSPMLGVIYLAPAPGEKPYVEVGHCIKKGDTLCIIEAMKVFNEVISDFDGEIIDICITDGQVVEFSQVLFKLY